MALLVSAVSVEMVRRVLEAYVLLLVIWWAL